MRVDVDEQPDLAGRFRVDAAPALVLVRGKRVVDRIDGRASAPKIESMLAPHLAAAAA
jgi:thioredoxin-like negative regulator of GroEL